MLNIKWIIYNTKKADEAFKRRGINPLSDKLIKLSKSRSSVFVKLEKLLEKRNEITDKISQITENSKKEELINEVKKLKNDITKLQKGKTSSNTELDDFLMELPNFLDETVPIGKNENDNLEIRKFGEIKKFNFKIKDHVELGENLDILDFKTAAKVSGSRFVYLKNNLARLERALASFMIDSNVKAGNFIELNTPFLVNESSL